MSKNVKDLVENLKEIKHFECSKCVNIQFTDDNIVNLNIGKGVHLVGLDSSSVSHQLLKRHYLPASSHVPLKYLLSTLDNQVMWTFDFNSMKEAFCATDAFEFFSKCPPRPFVVLSQLSPSHQGIRYLASVTNHGALEIYQEINLEWVEVFDVAENWLRECYSCMERPNTWTEWRNLLELGKPTTFCWTQLQDYLLLIVALKNGETAVFCKTNDNEFSMKLTKRFSCALNSPVTAHAFAVDDKVCVVIGYVSGKMTAFTFDPFGTEQVDTSFIWDIDDYLTPKDMVSVKKADITYLITSKYNFLLIHSFDKSGCFATSEKDFGEVVKCVGVSDKNVYVAFDNGRMLNINLPSGEMQLEVRCPDECNKTLEGIAISRSGLLWVIASSLTWTRCRISFLTLAAGNAVATLDHQLSQGATLVDNLDLLWLLKLNLLDANSSAATVPPSSDFSKLLYWKLQLRLAGEADETLEGVLKTVEAKLVDAYAESLKAKQVDLQPFLRLTGRKDLEFCPICNSAIISSDVRVVECAKAHVLPRCCITFKPCATAFYAVCTLCDAIALLASEPGFPTAREHICPYCDGTFRINHGLA